MTVSLKLSGLAAVILLVAACSSSIAVPDVSGEDQGYAKGVLVGAGFEVETVEEAQAGVTPGQVLSQVPAAGEEANPEETTVTLYVAVSPEYTLTGTFQLLDPGSGPDANCRGDGGYSDISGGTDVVVRDGSGSVLAKGALGPGRRNGGSCTFQFTVRKIPEVDFYEVEVGRRGSLTYSFDELEARDWQVGFTLG